MKYCSGRSALVLMFFLSTYAFADDSFEIWNKLRDPIEISLGSDKNPPSRTQFIVVDKGSRYSDVTVGKSSTEKTQLLLREKEKPEIAFLYEFTPGKTIYIVIDDKGKGSVLAPQTKTFLGFSKKTGSGFSLENNVGIKDIILLKIVTPTTISPYAVLGIRERASDSEILGLNASELNDINKVNKTYRALVLKWHPDKMVISPAKERYAQFKRLSEQEKKELANKVFQLIHDVYDRTVERIEKRNK